ncbi:hypothetical protein V2J09_014929 [Rumex salicifolius]
MKKEEKRHQMMQNLFGDQSEDEEEVEIDSEHESSRHPNYISDEGDGGQEQEGEGEEYMEGQGEAELESEGEMHEVEQPAVDSEVEPEQSSQEVEGGEQQEESDARETDSDSKGEYAQGGATSRRRAVVDSGSERSEDHRYVDQEDDEGDQARSSGGSAEEEREENQASHPVAEIRDVFGDSDEEVAEYGMQDNIEQEYMNKSPAEEEESYEKNFRADDLVQDDEYDQYESRARYESDEENIEAKSKDKPTGPPLEFEIPLRPPPAQPEKMNLIRVSNIMGIDPKPFDPKTYVEEDVFVTDESGTKKRIRLENNIVRWRNVRKSDGSFAYESNARFVRWSDGSLQLLIGNEVLDISVQDAQHDHAAIFLRHGKGILQSQGKLMRKMRFMPSSLTSNSHRLLTALVDSRHKKVYKVKNCVTDVDPEREKEQKAKVESQTIRANMLLSKKRERVNRKYSKPAERGRQLSPGFLEDGLDEDEEQYYDRRPSARRRFEDDFEAEARAENRIINAKKARAAPKDIPRRSSMPAAKPSRRPADFSESEREESEYETEGEAEESPQQKPYEDSEPEYVDSEQEEQQEEEARDDGASEEAEEEQQTFKDSRSNSKRKGIESDEEASPPRKPAAHRRMAVVYDSDED